MSSANFTVKQTSGFFTLSSTLSQVSPNPVTMHLYVSNYANVAQTASFTLYKLMPTGKVVVMDSQISVPADGVGQVELAMEPFFGQTLEVVFGFETIVNAFLAAPSVNIIETFLADGATLPLLYIAPGAFAFLPLNQSAEPEAMEPHFTITSGMFDVPQGVAAARPMVNLVLDNETTSPQTATLTVNKRPFGSAKKQQVLSKQVTIPGNQSLPIPLDAGTTGIEGLPTEIVLTAPVGLLGVRLIEPSANITRVFTADGSFENLLFLGPTAFRLVEPLAL